uniref:Uncharacterized protein n=1 Tax=Glossina austeni TaxID=7395 RepID=A0A1A9UWG3_GLOAU
MEIPSIFHTNASSSMNKNTIPPKGRKASSIMLLSILSLLSFGLFVALSSSSEESIKLISCNLYIRVVSRPLPPTLVLAESRAFRDYTLDGRIDKEKIKLTKTNHRPLAQAVNVQDEETKEN